MSCESRHKRVQLFGKALDRLVIIFVFESGHDYNAVAKILEARALYLRFCADELLSENTEVPTKE